jgi:hypothetical protein
LVPFQLFAFFYDGRMESPRLPRFKRASNVAPMQLTERDRKIIGIVHKHRFLRSSHILSLISGSSQQLLRRLQLLYHHSYLERPRSQIEYYQRGGSRHMVYGIGQNGATLLKQEPDIGSHRSNEKNRAVGQIFLEHALLVSDVMVSIELACRQSGRIRLISEEELPISDTISHQRQPFKWKVSVNNRLKLGVIPDRVFALEYPNQADSNDRAFFFLEADRATMPVMRRNLAQTSFYRKLLAYQATWTQAIHHAQFGFHRFRMLTVTTSAERVRSMVNACSQLNSGHGLFLFTDQASLAKSGDILSLPWQTGRRGETTSLLN